MTAIEKQRWGEATEYKWEDLATYKWEGFRFSLMQTDVDFEAQGVTLVRSGALYEVSGLTEAQGVNVEHSMSIVRMFTEIFISIVVSDRDYKATMLDYLPWYERESGTIDDILTAIDKEFRRAEQDFQVTQRNQFIDTAIELLSVYEKELAIEKDEKLTYVQRREQIVSRYRTAFEQSTYEVIENAAVAFSGNDVLIRPTSLDGVFEIEFIGTLGIPPNIDGLKSLLDVIAPAHIELKYTFVFNKWEKIEGKTWEGASDLTWREVREEEIL